MDLNFWLFGKATEYVYESRGGSAKKKLQFANTRPRLQQIIEDEEEKT